MAVKKIIYIGSHKLQTAEHRFRDALASWVEKWFGQDLEWDVKISDMASEQNKKLDTLDAFVGDPLQAARFACLALGFDAEKVNVIRASIASGMGEKILTEFSQIIEGYENGDNVDVIINPNNPLEALKLRLYIRDQVFVCQLPVTYFLNLTSMGNTVEKQYGVSAISVREIAGMVRLNVELSGVEIKLSDLLALETGDVLTLDHSIDAPARVKNTNGEIVMVGQLGKTGEKKSIFLTGAGS